MNRRSLLAITIGGIASIRSLAAFAEESAPALDAPIRVDSLMQATRVKFDQLNSWGPDETAIGAVFITYEFATGMAVKNGYAAITDGAQTRLQELGKSLHLEGDAAQPYRVSVGQIGEERVGYVLTGDSPYGFIVARVGNAVITCMPGGNIPAVIETPAAILRGICDRAMTSGTTLVPTVDDMPIGWSQTGDVTDVTKDARA